MLDKENLIDLIGRDEDLLQNVLNLYEYVKSKYYDYCDVPLNILYMIQDIVWYNLECKDKHKGLNTLKDKGSKFKMLSMLDNNAILNKQDKAQLKQELNEIIKLWDSEWDVITVYTDIPENEKMDLQDIIIHDINESPRKYNYYKKTNLLDEYGHNIFQNKNVMLGELNGKLGEYYLSNILKDNAQKILNFCEGDKFLFICENEAPQ